MLIFACACGKAYNGKAGYYKLQRHIAEGKPGCSAHNRTSFGSAKTAQNAK